MKAWKENENIDFNFYDAHDLATVLDTSQPETIRRRIRERLSNTKQVVLLVGSKTRSAAGDPTRFLYYEMNVITKLNLPVVIANLNQSRVAEETRIPKKLLDPYTMSVSFQPKVIKYALDNFPQAFPENLSASKPKTGPYFYMPSVYASLNL